MFTWLSSTSTEILLGLFLVTAMAGMGTYFYVSITHLAAQNASLEAQNKELQQHVADQQKTIEQVQAIMDLVNQSLNAQNADVERIKQLFASINDYLNTKDSADKDRKASEILQKTIEWLSKQEQP